MLHTSIPRLHRPMSPPALGVLLLKINKSTLIVLSGKDEMVPPTIDKVALLKKWVDAMPEGLASKQSVVLPHAHHELTMDLGYQPFMDKVYKFLKELENGHGSNK